jgi:signal transduction histidine kinase
MAVLLGAAVFAPWSWEWQFGLAVTVVGGTMLLIFLRVPPAIIPAWALPRLVIVLLTVGAASVVGGHRAQRERDRIATSEARELAARLEATLEAQRTEIAREIHDELAQALTALKMDLAWLEKRLGQPSTELAGKMAGMAALIDRIAVAVQRIAAELRPGVLDELGLPAAIEWQAREFQARTGIACQVDLAGEASELCDSRATGAFRILQEALTNVARHASATRVMIRLRLAAPGLELLVEDNGCGISDTALRHPDSLGLLGMRERASNLGGSLRITGVAGRGTTVTLTMPRAA